MLHGKFMRSRFITASGTVLATLSAVCLPARGAQFEYKLADPLPADYSSNVRSVQMCESIKNETNGRLVITLFPNGELGSQEALVGQLRLGSIQFLTTVAYSSVVPSYQIFGVGFAFPSSKAGLAAAESDLGDYIRKEFRVKGLYAFVQSWDDALRQVTSFTKPIKNGNDFAGFKLRTQPSPIIVGLFKALGASPTPLSIGELYTGLQTHLVDGQEVGYASIETLRLYEVQKYLSITNHAWTNSWLVANGDAWDALPPDIQGVVERNVKRYTMLQHRDMASQDNALADKLRRQGLTFNTADTASIRAHLGSYYAYWKKEFGSTLWSLLENSIGRKLA